MKEAKKAKVRAKICNVGMLADMLADNIKIYCDGDGAAGFEYPRNINASQTAILNQITTLRNELLVLADTIKNY